MSAEKQGRVVWIIRPRGIKDQDIYETVKGFNIQYLGHTIPAVFDPHAKTETGFISWFTESL